MKIADIKAFPISFKVPKGTGVRLGIGLAVKRDAVLIKVTTDEGIIGWGEAFGYTSIETTKAALHSMIIPHLIGKTIETNDDIQRINKELHLKLHVLVC